MKLPDRVNLGVLVLALVVAYALFGMVCSARAEGRPAPVTELRIDGEINADTADVISEAMVKAPGSVTVRINSPGGSVFAGLRIIRALKSAPAPVTCEVEDMAASMAAVILESSACDVRVVSPSSLVMFHEVSAPGATAPRQSDAESLFGALRAINRSIAAIVAPRLGLSVDEYLSLTTGGREVWVAGLDAVSRGVADRVLP